jgi:expansin (peptidoglycan-binding protein)
MGDAGAARRYGLALVGCLAMSRFHCLAAMVTLAAAGCVQGSSSVGTPLVDAGAAPAHDASTPPSSMQDGATRPPPPEGDASSSIYGQPYTGGQYNLGPVDWAETQFHNACAPQTKYAPAIQQLEGTLLAGLWNGIPNVAGYCDACITVTTAKGKSALLRVVTYGDTSTNSLDVSPDAYALLNANEYPRTMTWQFAKCPDTGAIVYEFQTASSEYWTSLWVRNARVPLASVEVQSAKHATYVALTRGSDGTLTDASGFGKGSFSVRLTGIDGQTVIDTFAWPAAGIAGASMPGQGNFH